jgi:hypothetical protein
MKRTLLAALLAAATVACGGEAIEIPTGSDVAITKTDGAVVSGKLVEAGKDHVVLELAGGERATVSRREIQALQAAPAANPETRATQGTSGEDRGLLSRLFSRGPEYREVTIPAGTVLPIELRSRVASDSSRPEQPVSATLRRAIVVDGVTALPEGSAVGGHVVAAERSGRVEGRASVTVRFDSITPAGRDERLEMKTAAVEREARSTVRKDAAKIGIPAGAGAVVGGIIGGAKGAAKGAAIGGGAGAAVVLSTRGEEVRLGPGAQFSLRLLEPLTVRVPVQK